MTDNSLILNDTAMVLLRQYDEIYTHYNDIHDAFYFYTLDNSVVLNPELNPRIKLLYKPTMKLFELHQECLREIWLLWCYPDIKPIRHLDWHLMLDGCLIEWAEQGKILT